MKKEIIYSMPSLYREEFAVPSFHFGAEEKTVCVLGSLRGNEVQQLYICSKLVARLKELEEAGKLSKKHGVTVIPCGNNYSLNIGKRFWAMDNSDINRMFPGFNKGETTQRIAAGIFEKLQGYKYGIQLSSFYLPGEFVAHIRMMDTNLQDPELARLFGLPFVVVRHPVPFDTTTLNFNWQIWETKAFSLFTKETSIIDEATAEVGVSAILRFLARQKVIDLKMTGGFHSLVIKEENLSTVRAKTAGILRPFVQPFDEVRKGDVVAQILDPYEGGVKSEVKTPCDGVVFFLSSNQLIMEHTSVCKIAKHVHK